MSDLINAVLQYKLTPVQRLYFVWAFVLNGLLISVQLSQTQAPVPLAWTRLTERTRPYWHIAYVLQAFLLLQNTYPMLLQSLDGYFHGHEEEILNAIWIGLLGLEIAMVLGVAVRGLAKGLLAPSQPKQKTT
jgi:hypothetical protein